MTNWTSADTVTSSDTIQLPPQSEDEVGGDLVPQDITDEPEMTEAEYESFMDKNEDLI